jgi:hypothetical protein
MRSELTRRSALERETKGTTRANAERIRAASRRYYHRGPPVTLPAVSELGGQDRYEAISERGIPAPCLAWRSRGN